VAGQASPDATEQDATEQDARYGYRYYLTPTGVAHGDLEEPSLREMARVITAGMCIEASFQRGKGEAGIDAYQVRTWEGWHHHMALTLIAVWFLIRETHRGQQWTPALTLPQVRYGLSLLLLEVFCPLSVPSWLFRYVISASRHADFSPIPHESTSYSKAYEHVPSIVGEKGRVHRRYVTPARPAAPSPLAGQRCQSPR
jgi:hypothetical protein